MGVKTGFTNGAGRCLVTETIRGNKDIIVIVLGADTKKDRTRDSVKLIEYAFANFREFDLESVVIEAFDLWNNVNSRRIQIEKGKEETLKCYLSELHTKQLLLNQQEEKSINYEFHTVTSLKAPVEKNTKLGTLTIKLGDEIIEQLDIFTIKTIDKKNMNDYLFEFSQTILGKNT